MCPRANSRELFIIKIKNEIHSQLERTRANLFYIIYIIFSKIIINFLNRLYYSFTRLSYHKFSELQVAKFSRPFDLEALVVFFIAIAVKIAIALYSTIVLLKSIENYAIEINIAL